MPKKLQSPRKRGNEQPVITSEADRRNPNVHSIRAKSKGRFDVMPKGGKLVKHIRPVGALEVGRRNPRNQVGRSGRTNPSSEKTRDNRGKTRTGKLFSERGEGHSDEIITTRRKQTWDTSSNKNVERRQDIKMRERTNEAIRKAKKK